MWLAQIIIAVLSATLAGSTLIDTRDTSPLRKSDGNLTLVTGLAWGYESPHVPVRREIRDLKDNYPEQWNIYILGLRSFFDVEQTVSTSFYEIAGIHGKPFRIWQGAEGIPGKAINGYCPHQNTLFFGWHRPYLVLYEQELYKHVKAVAYKFPPPLRHRYIEAADSFRIPYWDWALGPTGGDLPDIFTSPTVHIMGTNGSNQTVPNPLHHYEFHPLMPGDFDSKFAQTNTTLRWPTTGKPDAVSQNSAFGKQFTMLRREFHDAVAKGFGTATSLNSFSMNHIEATHGNVHYIIGGANQGTTYEGHMWPVEYSAFEPLFMLVHCNVDRLFALWQAVHPDRWLERSNINGRGNFVLEDDAWVDGDTPLKPFWRTRDSFWSSNDARHTPDLGYAYPETQAWDFDTEDAYRAAVNASISRLYSSSARSALTAHPAAQGASLQHLVRDGCFLDWTINVAAPQHLTSSFIVRFSLSPDSSSDPPTPIGSWSVLMPAAPLTRPQPPQHGAALHGTVDLTPALLDQIAAGNLPSLDPGHVVPFLTQKLTWSVVSGEQRIHLRRGTGDLSVTVVSSSVRIPRDSGLPLEYSGVYTEYPGVTEGKRGAVA